MNLSNTGLRLQLGALLAVAIFSPQISNATIVTFHTVRGDIEVNLYDNATPATVANFLDYVNNGAYTSSVFHRSVAGFVIQGGGFTFNLALPLDTIPANPAVANEPEFSNVRGTIAMAKLQSQPDSATTQWYFNLADNSADLDGQNGGFTVFGEVIGDGMTVVDGIAALPIFNFDGAFAALPLIDYTATDFANQVAVEETHLVIINTIEVTDMNVDSAAGLNPPVNTGGQQIPPAGPPPPPANGGSGGGSLGYFGLFVLLLLRLVRPARAYRKNNR